METPVHLLPRSISRSSLTARLAVAAALAASTAPSSATENGGSTWPLGLENFVAAALPPPGFYAMVFGNYYHADRLKDGQGNTVPLPFDVKAAVVAPRLVWVTGEKVFGGQLAFHAVAPLVDLKVSVAGNSQRKSGLGDVTVGPVLGYHYSPALHAVAVLDFTLPTGGYDRNDLANIGRNYLTIRPVYAMSYIDAGGFNGDFVALYNHNLKNKDTDYRSGDEVNVDYSLGWGLGNGWVVGAGGHVYRQIADDKQGGVTVPGGNRGRSFSIGPSVKYDGSKGWFVTAKWQKETAVRNKAEGNALWVKAVFPL
jgi:hypothetical protein